MNGLNISTGFAILAAVCLSASAVCLADEDEGPVAVSPADEIEILDPRVDPEGKPRVVTKKTESGYKVEIPPAVIVHRYYYTGDRTFQGPLFPGGPSIIVVSHPRTGERLYLEAQLLPGAPLVTYRRHYIEYDYGKQRITLKFGHIGRPKVVFKEGERLRERTEERLDRARGKVSDWVHRTGFPRVVGQVARGTGGAVNASADRIRDVGRVVVTPATQILNALPGAQMLRSSVEERAARSRDVAVQRATRERERLGTTIRTLR